MIDYFKSKKIIKKNAVLCFDGLMVLKKNCPDLKVLQSYLSEIEKLIPLKLKIKEMLPMPKKVTKETYIDKMRRWLTNPEKYFQSYSTSTKPQHYTEYSERRTKSYDEFIDEKLVFIKEPKDSGKTFQVVKYIENLDSDKHILIITFRTTLSYEFEKRLKTMGFKNYQNIKGDINNSYKRVIVQAESLHRIKWDKCDLLINDEIESLLPQLISKETMTYMGACFNKFRALVSESAQVFNMDADIEPETIRFLSSLSQHPAVFRENKFNPRADDTIFYTTSQNMFISHIVADAKAGLKLVIGSNRGKYKLDGLKKYILNQPGCENLRIALITSETLHLEEVQQIIKDCENEETGFGNFDILIYSPSIQAGVSFNPPEAYFDKFYGWFCSNGRVNAVRQMIKRVRKLNTNSYVYCLNQIGGSRIPDNREDFEKFISSNRNFEHDFSIPSFISTREYLDGTISFPYKDEFYDLWSSQQILSAKDKNVFVFNFLKAEYLSGVGKFVELTNPDDVLENCQKKINDYTIEKKEEEAKLIFNADYLTEDLKSLQMKTNLTEEEYYQIRKSNIINSLELPKAEDLSIELISHCLNSKVQSYFYNLRQYGKALQNNQMEHKSALVYLLQQEQTTFDNTDKCQIKDIIKNYKAKRHYMCYKMVNHCGFDSILDNKIIDGNDIKKIVTDNKQQLIEGIGEIGALWGLKTRKIPNPARWKKEVYLKEVLKFFNPKLQDLYGIQIKKLGKNDDRYNIIRDDMICYDKNSEVYPNMFMSSEEHQVEVDQEYSDQRKLFERLKPIDQKIIREMFKLNF
jgi:hypothetical protein